MSGKRCRDWGHRGETEFRRAGKPAGDEAETSLQGGWVMQQANDRVVDAGARPGRVPVGTTVRPSCFLMRRVADARIAAARLQLSHSALGE